MSDILKIIKRIGGAFLYFFVKNINLRFFIPERFVSCPDKLKVMALKLQGAKIGKKSVIRNNIFIAFPNKLIIGKDTTLGAYARVFNYSDLLIGSNTEIGPGLHIQNNEHIIKDANKPLGKQGSFSKEIIIGDGVFIGANVTILQGVKISDLCIIAAGSVVIKDTETGYVYGGVPACKIKKIL
jgi:acetyltransferase-like isoleucine patch superfamily enzyme